MSRGGILPASSGWIAAAMLCGAAIGYLVRPSAGPAPEPAVESAGPGRTVAGERVLRYRRERPDVLDTEREKLLREIESLAVSSPDRARAMVEGLGDDPDLRAMALAVLAAARAADDPDAVAEWVESLENEEDRISAAAGLVAAWTEADPDACLAWCGGLADSTLREASLVELAGAWLERNPADVFQRFSAMDPEDGVERGLHGITAGWVLDDPDTALRHFSALPAEARRDEFLETALVSLTNGDPERVWREADTVPGRAEHIRAMALEAIAETDPRRAVALASTRQPVPDDWWRAIARSWAFEDPDGAASWAASQEDPGLRGMLLEEVGAGGGGPHAETPAD